MKIFTLKKVVLLCLFIAILMKTNAQTITGCVIYNSDGTPRLSAPMYTLGASALAACNSSIVQIYVSSPATAPLNTFCYLPNPMPNAPSSARNCMVGGNCGIIRTINIVPCPLDDYACYMILPLAVVGTFFIRKRVRGMRFL
ncbi:hypothetical protein [Pedobacter sp. Hv1]|uniref:hypothetical protein n=1 Tax=Pedobacter sp. Hv1 TaxID=1740090 RepID=UPI0006D88C1F|nr:hypothetical protein [Pedobacter sp. Hv1]KQC01858.1 hypothetical protein AQF98_05705 [Pedobacter sp. Hv1]